MKAIQRFIGPPDELILDEEIGKASPNDPLWRRLHAIADKAEPELRKKILRAIAEAASHVDGAALERALASGNTTAALRAIDWDGNGDKQLRAAYQTILRETYQEAGEATAQRLARDLDVPATFNLAHPRAEAWAESIAATRVKQVSEETVEALRSMIVRGFREGIHPRDLARQIRGVKDPETGQYRQSLIGLTERQAQAVWNYRASLEEDPNRPATAREQEKIDRMVERYRDKLVLQRAETIARHETMQASNEGQQELWRQAKEEGWLRGNEQREWLTTPDDKSCEFCLAMDGQRVGLGEEFVDPSGEFDPVMTPPLHVQCRCATGLVDLDDIKVGKYDPDQPRDEQGRWTDTGGGMDSEPSLSDLTSQGTINRPAAQAAGLDERDIGNLEAWVDQSERYDRMVDPKTEEGKAFVATLDKLPNHEGTVYRGAVLSPAAAKALAGKKELSFTRLASASKDSLTAEEFLSEEMEMRAEDGRRGVAVLYELQARTVKDISSLVSGVGVRHEAEVILGHHKSQKFVVTNMKRQGNQIIVRAKEAK